MAFGTASVSVCSCSATYQLCDLGKSFNLFGFSYLKCMMLIIASDHRVVARIQCVNT